VIIFASGKSFGLVNIYQREQEEKATEGRECEFSSKDL
jgi:hypothetical protein